MVRRNRPVGKIQVRPVVARQLGVEALEIGHDEARDLGIGQGTLPYLIDRGLGAADQQRPSVSEARARLLSIEAQRRRSEGLLQKAGKTFADPGRLRPEVQDDDPRGRQQAAYVLEALARVDEMVQPYVRIC